MTATNDVCWEARTSQVVVPKSPTDPCGASCRCGSAWRCGEPDKDCPTPYALHVCGACQQQTYQPPYWLVRGKVVVDRRTQAPSIIVTVRLGQSRQDSAVELLPNLDTSDTRPEYLRSLVIRVAVTDIEQHFEPTPHKIPSESLP